MSAREGRTHGMGRGIKRIAAIPTAIMANTVVVDIVNGAAVGGAVRATVKNATAHSGIASLRCNTSGISYLLGILDERPTGLPTVSAMRDVQRAIARSSSRDWRS